ncbi:hypothetical protein PCYB_008150 [Plasmodium cynomolgi strain B]|uniref:CYIR protein n=1 Tax=Plasmodium cynomolgi (strain B) TaxID=1120755 RepID=K6UFG6_PLACD|nr:hypothetical protein PCYB_008150 [Plasmodium cynomolgi strain B]GAB70066.1 hypothetical protein PCYB_008150 [Plasmodium cynomolgi strain B]
MNILYSLYKKYSKFNDIIDDKLMLDKQSFLSLSTNFCNDYIEASYITKYEEIYNKLRGKSIEYSNNFIKLSECEKTNTMTTALIGTTFGLIPFFGVLYKVKEINFIF